MDFSVVIPCYNAERWILHALESVASQTFSPREIIVIDDGSTDHSLQYLQNSSIPTAILQTQNLGPASARNAGIAEAKGDWVAFLDADDWWQPNHLERIEALVRDSNDVVYLAAALHYSMNVNRIVSQSDTGPFQTPTHNIDYGRYFSLYMRHGLLELSSMAVQLAHLKAVGGFDMEFSGAEDFELVLRLIYGKTWAYDPVPSSVYRCNNPDSYSYKATNPLRLTAKFRTLVNYQEDYNIPDSMLRGLGRTLMSKAIAEHDFAARQEMKTLVYPYLSNSQRITFWIANFMPALYRWANSLRNRLKQPEYKPRKVIH
ncbi:hypothetical protein C7271_16175 [filamentous cyanobacterium CCP5]|nr:hypothetical protein C7271_16175 [filamentous cyanobacterium CCP5]